MKKHIFEQILEDNLELIRNDFVKETNIPITKFSIKSIGDLDDSYRPMPSYLESNYLDDKIGIFANNFRKVYVLLSIGYKKNEEGKENLFVWGSLKYTHLDGGSNGTSVLDSMQKPLNLIYSLENGKLKKVERHIADIFIKVVFKFSDEQLDTIHFSTLEKLQSFELEDLFERENNVSEVELYKQVDHVWTPIEITEEIKKIIDNNIIQKK